MLSKPLITGALSPMPTKQKGVVLLITLIVLVAMTLAAIAMVRSVDTGNIIAGNLSFRQAATNSADLGIEAAANWLSQNKSGTYLYVDHNTAGDPMGYSSNQAPTPVVGQSWDDYWMNVLAPNNQVTPVKFKVLSGTSRTPDPTGNLTTDNAGNAVSYTIARLCNATGDPTVPGTGCSISTATITTKTFDSQGVGTINLQYANQVYYRITARVEGPRNTVSYVQAIVTM